MHKLSTIVPAKAQTPNISTRVRHTNTIAVNCCKTVTNVVVRWLKIMRHKMSDNLHGATKNTGMKIFRRALDFNEKIANSSVNRKHKLPQQTLSA